jgi:septation ring formation regulator EzrA
MENENKESQETQETTNEVSTPEDLEAIKAQFEGEKKAKAAVEANLAEKDNRIAALETELSEAKQTVESLRAEGVAISEAGEQAVAKYLDAVRLANPAIPQDIIAGDTIEDIDASLAQATTIAESVRANLEAQARETRVPAGAPPRGELSLEGLSPREKIAAGIQQKGGTS